MGEAYRVSLQKLLSNDRFLRTGKQLALNVRTVSGEKLAQSFCIMENFINLSPSFFIFYSLPHTWHFNILLTDFFFFTLYHLPMKTYKLIYSIQFFHHQNLCFQASLFHFIQINFACRLSL